MSDECACDRCRPYGWPDLPTPPQVDTLPRGEMLNHVYGCDGGMHVWYIPPGCMCGQKPPLATDREKRQAACINDLLDLIGYLPQGLKVLEKHGVSR